MNKVTRINIYRGKFYRNPQVEITRKDQEGKINSRRYLIKKLSRSNRIDFTLLRLVDFRSFYTWPDSVSATFAPQKN